MEVSCDGVDNDCDAATPDGGDADGDGFSVCMDCDDTNSQAFPGNIEVPCDGLDNDCDSFTVDDVDSDLDGVGECADCDDADAANYPGNAESCDGADNDCDSDVDNGLAFENYWPDVDGDSYGDQNALPVSACDPVADHVQNPTDCDDTDAAVNPDAAEIAGNEIDEDCDGLSELGDDPTGTTSTDTVPNDTGLGFDTGSDGRKGGCNCDTNGSPIGGVWVLLLGLVVRRRRV